MRTTTNEPSVVSPTEGVPGQERASVGVATVESALSPGRPARRPSLVWNATSNWLALAVNIAIGLFLTPFIISQLGKSGFGIWSLVGSVVGYYGLLQLGVTNAITPYAARYIGAREWHRLNEVACSAMMLFALLGLLALAISYVLADPLARLFHVTSDNATAFRHTIWTLGAAAAVGFPTKVLVSVIRAHERYVPSNIVVIASSVLRATLTVVFLLDGMGLWGAALAVLIADAVTLIANVFLCKHVAAHVCFRLVDARWRMLRSLLLYGGTGLIIVVSNTFRFNIDALVIGKYVGLEAVAVYAIAAALIRYFMNFVRSATKVLKPRFAILDGAGDDDALRHTMLRALRVSGALSFGLAMVFVLFGGRLITFWVGTEFSGAFPVLGILAVACAVELAQAPAVNVLWAVRRHGALAWLTACEAAMNLSLSLLLVREYGIVGVALGTAIPLVLARLFVLPWLISRRVKVSLTQYYAQLIWIAAAMAGVGVLIALCTGA